MSQIATVSTDPISQTPSGGEPIELATTDSISQLNENEIIASLAILSPMDFDRARKEQAKLLGIQVKTLDALVKAARSDASETVDSIPFADIDPHEEPIVPAQLLDEIVSIIRAYIVLDIEQAYAID